MRPVIFVPILSLGVASCGNLNSIHHTFRAEDGTSISVDAKQRAIFSVQKGRDSSQDSNWRVVCAEPSPDALAAISSSAAIDAEVAGKALGLALGSNESAASIGLRTQTIQLLRDGMYRLCEGYASSALDEIAFSRLQRRYQNVMLGLLAVEQLTGTVVASQVAMQSSAIAHLGTGIKEVSEALVDARGQEQSAKVALDEAKTKQADLVKSHAAAKAAYDLAIQGSPDGSSDVAKKAKATLDAADSDLQNGSQSVLQKTTQYAVRKNELESLESIRETLSRATSDLSSTITFSTPTGSKINPSSDLATGEVATVVKEIVNQIVTHDYTRETCLDTLLSRNSQKIISENKDTRLLEVALLYCAAALEIDAGNVGGDKADKLTRGQGATISAAQEFRKSVSSILSRPQR